MKVVFDVDGVLRDLNGHLLEYYGVPIPDDWKWVHEGKNIYDWAIKDRYRILKEAQPTEYFKTILEFDSKPELWTHQPKDWRPATWHWIRQHIGYDCKIFYLTTEQKRVKLDYEPDTWLVEDNPNFTSYERIVLIDRLYNHNVPAEVRVRSPKELRAVLEKVKHGRVQ